MAAGGSPYAEFSRASQGYLETIRGSETLKARARAIRDEIEGVVASALAASVGREPDDSDAHLAAGLLLASWTVAFTQGHRVFRRGRDAEAAQSVFLAIIDKGADGLKAAMTGTPYA